MRNVVLARVDDRLIHGEVVSVWAPSLSVNRIVIADDGVAADKFNSRVLKALAPAGVKVNVYSVDSAGEKLKEDEIKGERIMVLAKSPITFQRLVDKGVLIREVNLGGMGLRDERIPFIKNVSASPAEMEAMKDMRSKNVRVYYQLVPEQQIIEADDYLK
ncbi:PTS system mannose/fructose/N-acetylgalactosamine-transporter subunit IIB [Lacrimispora indolis]|uniref:PTS system mannose/fructose/N-acetylgalactosamine-transporter subunit IIB n=1 Tax=Lacrimispora indolis TaxID=69825 RepID=UPI00045E988F|nr:PTS sugar transporter subunit IIB [Lacrimispora indolis]MBE7722354.1 PTS sugar transporter subunit IIB [Lacrimispora celerecrescens]